MRFVTLFLSRLMSRGELSRSISMRRTAVMKNRIPGLVVTKCPGIFPLKFAYLCKHLLNINPHSPGSQTGFNLVKAEHA